MKVTLYMPARASPSGFTIPYHIAISLTCGFSFGQKGRYHEC